MIVHLNMEMSVTTCVPLAYGNETDPSVFHPMKFHRTVVAMVGLPARGKTYIAKKMARYLNWVGISTRVFNVGDYRRKATNSRRSHNFFDRNTISQEWLTSKGEVGVFDATNSTRERREWVFSMCQEKMLQVMFVESICDNEEIIEASIREVKIHSPDYDGCSKDEATKDFKKSIQHYEETYETIDEILSKDKPFIKIYNQGEKFVVNKVRGNILSRIVYFLMNICVLHRTIYLTRHGESILNQKGRIGGDSDLSPNGILFAKKLAEFIKNEKVDQLKVWTSCFKRTFQTAQFIEGHVRLERWKALNEIDAGVCEEMTYGEIQFKYPLDFSNRSKDKYRYRYHMGESYEDLVSRLEPVIMELERESNVLVVSHQAVTRCLLAYFLDNNKEELPYLKVPLHTVIKLTPLAHGCDVEYFDLGIPESS